MKRAIDAMDEAGESAERIGTSTENFTALGYAAKLSASSAEELEAGMVKLARAIDAAKSGSGPAAEAFRSLRIDPAQFTDPSDALLALAERFAEMPDGVNKTALAMDLFGKSGARLIPLLNRGRDGIEALKAEAAELGIVLDGEAAAAAGEFNDQLDRLSASSRKVGIDLATEMLPGLNQITAAMAEAAKEGSIFKTLAVGLGGLGTALYTDDLLTNSQKLTKLQERLTFALSKGRTEEDLYVRSLRDKILVLGNAVAAEEKAEASARDSAANRKKDVADRKAENDEFKKASDERIKDAERLQSALQSAFTASIKAEEDYLRQAKKLRAEANGTATVGDDPESQASARLDAVIAAMKLQREAGSANLETVQDQAEALRQMADQIEDVRIKEDLRRQANLAEATALERAAAEEKSRYEELAKQQAESVRQSQNLQAAVDGLGKEVSVEIKPGALVEKTKEDLKEIVHLLEVIKQAGPLSVSAAVPGASATADSLRTEALKYGRR